MPKRPRNAEMFALTQPPAERLVLGGAAYRLVRVFKHDFWAATCLYELVSSSREPGASGQRLARSVAAFPRIVVKMGRTQPLWGLPMAWYGRWLADHEQDIYMALAGIDGVPRWAGRLSDTAYAIEYIDARPLDHVERPPAGFFDRLRVIFDAIHARGVAYGDANKRSNILVTDDGRPFLIDYQISIRRRDGWPWPLRPILAAAVAYLQAKDIYHLYKHKRRLAADELRPEEEELSRRRGGLHGLHRRLAKPYRALRRRVLQTQYQAGMRSPTEKLEDHYQPEKETWRKE